MTNLFSELSASIAAAVARAADSVVQVHGRRRPTAGVVFGPELVVAPSRALGNGSAVVRLADGTTLEGHVLGHDVSMSVGVVRVANASARAAEAAPEPHVGALAVAVGRTWSGGVMASVTNVAVVGGPLRTGRASQIERVIRIAQPPHGALSGGALADPEGRVLGVITESAIRGTAVVIPATLAFAAAHRIVERGGAGQGFLGVGSMPVALPAHQRHANGMERGLLVTSVLEQSPAATAGLLVGDVIVAFSGEPIGHPETLLTLLSGNRVGTVVTIGLLRGAERRDVSVTIGERPRSSS